MKIATNYRGKVYKSQQDAAAQAAKDLHDRGWGKEEVDRRFAVGLLHSLPLNISQPYTEQIVKALKDEDPGVRHWAVVTLGELRTADPVHALALAPLIVDPDPGVRYWAIVALERMGSIAAEHVDGATVDHTPSDDEPADYTREQLPGLTKALTDDNPDNRVAAAKAIACIDPNASANAATVLAESLKDWRDYYRASSVAGLGCLGPAAMSHLAQLTDALDDTHPSVRKAAAKSFGAIGRDAVKTAAEKLGVVANSDMNVDVRSEATATMSLFGLAPALEDADTNIRLWAMKAVVALGKNAEPHLKALGELIEDENNEIRYLSTVSLGEIGKPAAEHKDALMARLQDAEAKTRVAAAKAIYRVHEDSKKEAACILAGTIGDKDESYRIAAGQGLEALEDASLHHAAVLVETLKDQVPDVRLAAMLALTASGRAAVKPNGAAVAEVAKKDPDPYVRRAAVESLRKFMLSRRYELD